VIRNNLPTAVEVITAHVGASWIKPAYLSVTEEANVLK
jgi:hypothetical protein